MAAAGDHRPFPAADVQGSAVADGVESFRRVADAVSVLVAFFPVKGAHLFGDSVTRKEPVLTACIILVRDAPQEGGDHPFPFGHAEFQPVGLGEPAGEPAMVGMVVRRNQLSRSAAGRRSLQKGPPDFLGQARSHACIDDGPGRRPVRGVDVLQKPEIDVIEGQGKRHAHPVNPRRDLHQVAGRRRVDVEIVQSVVPMRAQSASVLSSRPWIKPVISASVSCGLSFCGA